jgi:signal transduction histidine kinase
VARAGGRLVVEIEDNGVGGADPAHCTGLRGLADRVEALGGTFRLAERPGGGASSTR